ARRSLTEPGDGIPRYALVEGVASPKAAAVLAELPREQAVALALTLDDVGERHWFLGGKRLAERLDEDLRRTATCQTDVEGPLIAHAVRHQPRLIPLEHLLGNIDDAV